MGVWWSAHCSKQSDTVMKRITLHNLLWCKYFRTAGETLGSLVHGKSLFEHLSDEFEVSQQFCELRSRTDREEKMFHLYLWAPAATIKGLSRTHALSLLKLCYALFIQTIQSNYCIVFTYTIE